MTDNQLNILYELHNERGIDTSDKSYHGNTFNSLEKKGMIKWVLYANCSMYEITDKGIDKLKYHITN